jgi:hypothetical protein
MSLFLLGVGNYGGGYELKIDGLSKILVVTIKNIGTVTFLWLQP